MRGKGMRGGGVRLCVFLLSERTHPSPQASRTLEYICPMHLPHASDLRAKGAA